MFNLQLWDNYRNINFVIKQIRIKHKIGALSKYGPTVSQFELTTEADALNKLYFSI